MSYLSNIKTAQGLFFFNALIWLAFGIYTLFGMAERYPGQVTVYVVGIMMIGNVGAMALSGILLSKQNKWFYYFAVFVLAINILLTFTDQVGFFDIATFAVDIVLFGILISLRKQYLSTL
jgi:hypothetical protein